MTSRAGQVLTLALKQNSISDILTENRSIFGPVYEQVVEWISEYHIRYNSAPSIHEVNSHFDEELLGDDAEGNISYELDALRDEYVKSEVDRMLIALANNLDKRSSEEILTKMVAKANELQRLTSKVKDIDITDVELALEDFARAKHAEENNSAGIMSGIEAWDYCLPQGMQGGNSIILMGFSGRGKSFIADYIAANAYLQGKTVMLVSLEMSAADQRARILAILAKGSLFVNSVANGDVDADRFRDWGVENLNTGGKIIVVEQDSHREITPVDIQVKQDKHRADLIILDYLQLASDNARTKEMTPRMMNLSREIKLLATSNNVPVISIAAVTDDESKKRDAPPRASQLAWSRAIEYDSDLILSIHKYDDTPFLEVIARKSRRSPLFAMRYTVDLERGVFDPMMEEENV